MKTPIFPEIQNLNQLFSAFSYRPVEEPTRRGEYSIHSPLTRTRGGRYTWDGKRQVMTHHHGPKFGFYRLQGVLRPEYLDPIEDRCCCGQLSSFEAILWGDGRFGLFGKDTSFIGQPLITILPAGYDLAQHLSDEDKAFIAADEAAQIAAKVA